MDVSHHEDLDGFRRAQRIAFSAACRVEAALEVGMTEREAADLLRARLAEAGVRHYFHVPFAWFGDRTELADDWSDDAFLPTDRRLERGMPVILDVGPIVDGYVADIGHSFAFGENERMRRMLEDLAVYRRMLPEAIREGRSQEETYRLIDDVIRRQGYRNRHRAYPFGVIGHRVARLLPGVGDERIAGAFGPAAIAFFKERMQGPLAESEGSPFWSARSSASQQRPAPGLWAIEPHIGRDGIGAKWEELLVVTEDDAYWLDDDVPHVRRWNDHTRRDGSVSMTQELSQ